MITEYKLFVEDVCIENLEAVNENINSLIQKGWQPFNSPWCEVTGPYISFAQVLVKYKKEVKDD